MSSRKMQFDPHSFTMYPAAAKQPRRWRPWIPASIFVGLVTFALIINSSTIFAPRDDFSLLKKVGDLHPAKPRVTVTATATATAIPNSKPSYTAGVPDPKKQYRKAVIVSSIKKENTSWVAEKLPDVDAYIYVNDDQTAKYTVPQNKGNEVMPYLTFIIDHYNQLPDIMIFVHAHEQTYHNSKLFDASTPQMINALNPHRVIREGYMNLNCGGWGDGKCTAQIRPAEGKPFEFHRTAWMELFPEYPLPQVLSQFCCAQFAVSRERVLQIPLAKWTGFREWLLNVEGGTPGYLWEYLWQFILKGEHVYCPASHKCYCDGYNLCFGTEQNFAEYVRLQDTKGSLLGDIHAIDIAEKQAKLLNKSLPDTEVKRRRNMIAVAEDLNAQMLRMKANARERAKNSDLRAAEIGIII